MAELPTQRAGTIITMVSNLSWGAQTGQVCLLKSLNPSPGDSWLSLSGNTAGCFGEPWCWSGDLREGAARPLPTDHHTHHRCQCCRLVAPHHPLHLSQRQQAAAPWPQAQVFATETTVLGNSAAFPAWGNLHPATGLNSLRKGGRKIGKTITRICFMLPGSLPTRSSVFGRPIYNQQCGML